MPLALVNYAATFLPSSPSGNNQIRVIQAAEASVMEAGIDKALSEIVALNADALLTPPISGLGDPPWPDPFVNGNKFVLADVALAGAGDGHTFALTMQFVRFAMASNTLLNQFLAGFLPSQGTFPNGTLTYNGPPNPPSGVINSGMDAWFGEFFDPSLLRFKACLAGDGATFQGSFENMIVRLRAAFPNLNGVLAAPFQGIAGSAKGTRIMGVAGGYQT